MTPREMYLKYKYESLETRRFLIKKMALANNLTIKEVVESIMPFILAEKPQNRLGSHVLIVGRLEYPGMFTEAKNSLKRVKKRIKIYSLLDYIDYQEEDQEELIKHVLNQCDTVYFLNGWYKEPLAHKIMGLAKEQKKILTYQEYEV